MKDSTPTLPESIECPLCLGKGELSRAEVLERLGMKDFTRVAQLSAEEAMRVNRVHRSRPTGEQITRERRGGDAVESHHRVADPLCRPHLVNPLEWIFHPV